MLDKVEIDSIILILKNVIDFIVKINPELAENEIIVEVEKVIEIIQSIGI